MCLTFRREYLGCLHNEKYYNSCSKQQNPEQTFRFFDSRTDDVCDFVVCEPGSSTWKEEEPLYTEERCAECAKQMKEEEEAREMRWGRSVKSGDGNVKR